MKGSLLPFPSFHPPSVHPLSFISLRSWFIISLHFSPLHVSLSNLHRHSMRHTLLSISLHHQNTHNWSFHRVRPVWAPPQAQAPSILRGSSVESLSWKCPLKRILKNQWVCKLKKHLLLWTPYSWPIPKERTRSSWKSCHITERTPAAFWKNALKQNGPASFRCAGDRFITQTGLHFYNLKTMVSRNKGFYNWCVSFKTS